MEWGGGVGVIGEVVSMIYVVADKDARKTVEREWMDGLEKWEAAERWRPPEIKGMLVAVVGWMGGSVFRYVKLPILHDIIKWNRHK